MKTQITQLNQNVSRYRGQVTKFVNQVVLLKDELKILYSQFAASFMATVKVFSKDLHASGTQKHDFMISIYNLVHEQVIMINQMVSTYLKTLKTSLIYSIDNLTAILNSLNNLLDTAVTRFATHCELKESDVRAAVLGLKSDSDLKTNTVLGTTLGNLTADQKREYDNLLVLERQIKALTYLKSNLKGHLDPIDPVIEKADLLANANEPSKPITSLKGPKTEAQLEAEVQSKAQQFFEKLTKDLGLTPQRVAAVKAALLKPKPPDLKPSP